MIYTSLLTSCISIGGGHLSSEIFLLLSPVVPSFHLTSNSLVPVGVLNFHVFVCFILNSELHLPQIDAPISL